MLKRFLSMAAIAASTMAATTALEAEEMLIGFFQREGTPDEGDRPLLVQAVGQVGEAGRLGRDFAAAAQVDAVQDAPASRLVDEPASVRFDGHIWLPVCGLNGAIIA